MGAKLCSSKYTNMPVAYFVLFDRACVKYANRPTFVVKFDEAGAAKCSLQ